MKEVYEKCPVLENDKYLLRLVEIDDAKDLLKVYSDVRAVPYFNSDNCNGDNFFYKTFVQMQEALKYWILEYERKGFVRWSIIDKNSNEIIGTIELFHRTSQDHFNACAILRMYLRSDYENEKCVYELLTIILSTAYDLFECTMIATKAASFARERIDSLKRIGFKQSEDKLTGHDGTEYGNYWIRLK